MINVIREGKLSPQETWQNLEMYLNGVTLERQKTMAAFVLRRMFWQGVRNGTPPGGHQEEDYVHMAIIKVKTGLYCWDPYKNTIEKFLHDIVRDLIRNHARGLENRCVRCEAFFEQFESEEKQERSIWERISSSRLCPDEILVESEKQGKIDILFKKVKDVFYDDRSVSKFFNRIEQGCLKRTENAKRVKVKVNQIIKKKRRLCNKCREKFQQEWQDIQDDPEFNLREKNL